MDNQEKLQQEIKTFFDQFELLCKYHQFFFRPDRWGNVELCDYDEEDFNKCRNEALKYGF